MLAACNTEVHAHVEVCNRDKFFANRVTKGSSWAVDGYRIRANEAKIDEISSYLALSITLKKPARHYSTYA